MTEIAFAVPILPGKEDLDRRVLAELEGDRLDELLAVMREAGLTRQTVWHQQTPDGIIAIVYMEMEDEVAERRFAGSDAEVMRYFVEQMKEVHGVDISEAGPQVERVFDVRAQPAAG